MARIEISINEYNTLHTRIKKLEEALVNKEKENKKLKLQLEISNDKLENLKTLSFFERLFHWKRLNTDDKEV